LSPRLSLLLLLALAPARQVYGAETPIPAPPAQWVTDNANFLSPAAVQSLNARLADYERKTGRQLIVYITPTTGDTPIEDWAVRAFAKWKIGRKGLDDGLALFIMPQDRRMRIEVGYGLEPVVPDAIASRVINDVMTPKLRAGQNDQAVTAAIDSLIGVLGGQSDALPPVQTRPQARPLHPVQLIFWGILGILFLGVLITNPGLAFFFLASILSGGRGGFGGGGYYGGGGGGFGGGGGRSGGGGASGSW
jgi:uncharacterized protein